MEVREAILKVGDLMTRYLISVEAEESVMTVAKLMEEKEVSSVLVRNEKGVFMGIITDRDVISRVVSRGLNPSKIKVSEVMSYPLVTINAEASIEEAAEKMRNNKIRRLIVEVDQRKVGIIAESDIVRVSPEFHLLIRERSKLEALFPESIELQEVSYTGFCEDCGNHSTDLINFKGKWLCEECRS